MAISVISDLVMDVVRAADPQQVQVAQEKLKANKAAFAATSLADAGKGFGAAVDVLDSAASKAGLGDTDIRAKRTEVPETYRKFEASVLQSFVSSMLPKETEDVYGKGNAGEIWKSMMAEQIADVISKEGGVGIAEQAYKDALRKVESKGLTDVSANDKDHNAALRMVAEFERQVLGVSNETTDKA
ncbi:rod-binding protein [Rhizobium sp. RM]|uniref:rod-binding protein n=1 Tax=Rhizobium/Agrobacterium group TaxID=227290 RepID=UPI0015B51030|nr:rod-binding protein [Rhizobium sp. RM]